MIERELSAVEAKEVMAKVDALNIDSFKVEYDRKSSDHFFLVEGKQYRMIFDREGDWFLDIGYEGEYQ
jgi:hypothetical protein